MDSDWMYFAVRRGVIHRRQEQQYEKT
jgi:hypothetical protein